jgi:prolyl oligopeptidase
MKKIISFIMILAVMESCKNEAQMEEITQIDYPQTVKGETVDNYFGTDVKDPYRWLEDDRSAETEAWVKEQNKVTYGFLNQIPYRDQLNKRLTEIWN